MYLRPLARRTYRHYWMAWAAIGALMVTSHVRAQEATTYSYDALGRLVSTNTSGGPNSGTNTTACFDSAGNRLRYMVGASTLPVCASEPSSLNAPATEPEANVSASQSHDLQSSNN